MKLSIPLVGMQFRPPAAQVLSVLPIGTTLKLVPEPENPKDSNAIRVVVDLDEISSGVRIMLDAILDPAPKGIFWLGYVAATGGKPARGGPGNVEALLLMSAHEHFYAKLGAAPEGYPTVELVA